MRDTTRLRRTLANQSVLLLVRRVSVCLPIHASAKVDTEERAAPCHVPLATGVHRANESANVRMEKDATPRVECAYADLDSVV